MPELLPSEIKGKPVYLRKNSWWIRLGCLLTGYNCSLLRQCSEASYKKLKRYMASMLLVMIIWMAVGYFFSKEYFKLDTYQALGAGIGAAFIAMLVERVIILSVGKNLADVLLRIFLGIVMAVIGATVIDQVIFREDIQKAKTFAIQAEVDSLVPFKTKEIRREIAQLDSTIALKESEKSALLQELSRKPVIAVPTVTTVRDSTGKIIRKTVTTKRMENPQFEVLKNIDRNIKQLKERRMTLEDKWFNIRNELENELKERKGFLDELKLLKKVIFDDRMALGFWVSWFLLLFVIELLVALTKVFFKKTDYEYLVEKMNEDNMR